MADIYIYKCEKCNKEFEKTTKVDNGFHINNSDCGGAVKFLKIKEPELIKFSKNISEKATIEDFREISTTVFDEFLKYHYDLYVQDSLKDSVHNFCSKCGSKLHENIEFSFDKTSTYWRKNEIIFKNWKICLKCKDEKDMHEAERNKNLLEELERIKRAEAEKANKQEF